MRLKLLAFFLLLVAAAFIVKVASTKKPQVKEPFSVHTYSYPGLLLSFPGLREVVADALYMETAVKVGNLPKEGLKEEEFKKLIENFRVIHRLDPYYFDPYYLEGAYLSWEARSPELLEMINRDLIEGMEFVKDWKLPFFVGFNYFYLMNEPVKGAEYLKIASKMERAPYYLPFLVQRLYAKSGRYELAIAVTQEELKEVKDERLRKYLLQRLDSLKKMLVIQKALERYRELYGKCPENLEELVKAGLLKSIPKDPTGGEYYVTEDCSVWTTSNLRSSTSPFAR